ncbi:hypothetical protein NC653_037953 [Populus alba x Populus x berolinensis]|uniref:Uncharacterized protein n=1 Tax=Populus alba x Populus x berolinensis TaxID=444605 RepID=A0AAD6LFN9_9ROSI|nr:hypothetical protein NC653_037953 [Populus alba x Populus x berolinensis]
MPKSPISVIYHNPQCPHHSNVDASNPSKDSLIAFQLILMSLM